MRSRPSLVPPQLLAGEPALALHEGALDLAEIDRGIERGAAILHQVGAQHAALAGQRVDRHLRRRRAEGEIEERPAAHRRAIPVDLGRLVEAGRPTATRGPASRAWPARRSSRPGCCRAWRCARCRRRTRCRLGAAPKCSAAKATMRCLMVLAASQAAQPLRSEPVEAAVGEVLGTSAVEVARGPDAVDVDLEHLGHDLRHLDEQPLPHLGAAVVQADRAVGIDMHQRAGLVHVRHVEGDAELQREQAEPALQDRAGLVEGVDLGAPALEVAAPASPRPSSAPDGSRRPSGRRASRRRPSP